MDSSEDLQRQDEEKSNMRAFSNVRWSETKSPSPIVTDKKDLDLEYIYLIYCQLKRKKKSNPKTI